MLGCLAVSFVHRFIITFLSTRRRHVQLQLGVFWNLSNWSFHSNRMKGYWEKGWRRWRLRTGPRGSVGRRTRSVIQSSCNLYFVYIIASSHYFKLMIKNCKLQLMYEMMTSSDGPHVKDLWNILMFYLFIYFFVMHDDSKKLIIRFLLLTLVKAKQGGFSL